MSASDNPELLDVSDVLLIYTITLNINTDIQRLELHRVLSQMKFVFSRCVWVNV
jgi:hypothetical protein